ncbi:MAG: insulinase family protein, partial [Oscillospiraceae bacterium]|nr:insulinase family protein [Oscillospiraceae bacterium]
MNNMELKEYTRIGEKVFSGVLPNGLRIKVIEKPEFVTGYAVFATRYGGAWRRFRLDGELIDTPAGIAHFLEHKMFDMPDGENALEVLAANGANPNAFTASDVTCYYFESTESFEENLRMLLKFVSTPYFTAETVQKEQGIIGQEIMMGEDNPGNRIYYNFLKLLYSSHPIRDEIAGTVESIAGITAKTLYDCHRVFYNPVNMVLIVEGPVEAEKIYDIALETVTSECGTMPEADFGPDEGTSPHERFREEAMEVALPQFLFGSKIKPEQGDLLLKQKLTATLSLNLLLGTSSGFYNDLYKKGLLNPGFGYDADY